MVRRGLLVLAIIATIVIALQQRHRAAGAVNDAAERGAVGNYINDFDRWMGMTPAFVRQHVDYDGDHMPTPPITLMIFAPFTALSRPNAQFAWVLVKLPVVCAIFGLVAAIVRGAGVTFTARAVLLIVAGWWLSVIVDVQEGQMNLVVLLPLAAGLWLAQRETSRGDLAAGAMIGLSAAMKLTPLAFVAYFLWRRRWTVAAAAAASILLAWFAIPALAFGWSQNLKWFGQWSNVMLLPYVTNGTLDLGYPHTQSVGSFAMRTLMPVAAFSTPTSDGLVPHYINVASLNAETVRRLVRVLMIATAAAGLWWMRHTLPTLRSRRYVFELGAVAAFMLWFSERTWIHHYVTFVLLLGAAAMIVSDTTRPTVHRRRVTCAVLGFFAITLFASEAGGLFGPDGVDWMKTFGVYLLPSIALTGIVLRHADRLPASDSAGATSDKKAESHVRAGSEQLP
jgi:alpha-1,2-mannosyltransferase